MDKIHLSVVIPSYNEEKNVSNTLLAIDHYLSKKDYSYEIVVVNDGSTDKTAEIVKKFTNVVKNLRLIDNQINHGKGWVVRQGMLEAKGKYRLFMDMDNSTAIEHVEKMWPLVERGYQVVIGSRDGKDAPGATQAVPQPFLKRLMGNMGNLLIQLLAVPGIWDTQCGFKMFSDQAAEKVFSCSLVDRWGFDVEALALAKKFKYKIGTIPIYWKNNPESRVKLKSYLGVFRDVFKVRWRLMTKKYG